MAALWVCPTFGQNSSLDWQVQVRECVQAREWDRALQIVEREIARAPRDMDTRAWRARVLSWSGRLKEAEDEYVDILRTAESDPDDWMGLAIVYLREGKIQEAERAISAAEKLDPNRPDIRVARGRILRVAGETANARSEFQEALHLDPVDTEAREGLDSLRGQPKHEFRLGQDNDLLSYTSDYHDEWTSLTSRWTQHWMTSVAGDFYQRAGVSAGKFVGAVTLREPGWGALTGGGAIGHDYGVIPKSEVFFSLDHGWKTGETASLRGVEVVYGQHWYWYRSARILTLSGTTIVYLPREWTFTLGATGSRSAFSATGAEWRPSGLTRLEFPLEHWVGGRLFGNTYFAVGTENFSIAEQIGRFASQTYGGGLRVRVNARQEITGYAGYQKRTQNRTDTTYGLSYGIYF